MTFEDVKGILKDKISALRCKEPGFKKSRKEIMSIVWNVVGEIEPRYEITNEEFGQLIKLAWKARQEIPEVCHLKKITVETETRATAGVE